MKYLWLLILLKVKEVRLCTHRKNQEKFKRTLKQITKRNNGKGYAWLKATIVTIHTRLANLLPFSRHEPIYPKDGWLVSSQKDVYMEELEENQHQVTNLQKCGINKHQAWQWANTRKDTGT